MRELKRLELQEAGIKEERKMKNTEYNYTFDSGQIFPHEIEMISRGSCSMFFDTTFVYDSTGITAVYDCSGFKPLSEYRIEHTSDVLYILEKTLIILQSCREYMLIPERILLVPETVFYRQDTGDVKIAFIPIKSGESDLHRNILSFLIGIKKDVCDSMLTYLNVFAHKSCNDNLDMDDMLTLVGFLRRQLDTKLKEIA